MKEGWTTLQMSEVFDLQMGKTPNRDNSNYWGGPCVWVAIGDMNSAKYISDSKEHISSNAVTESGIKQVPSGCVIMSFKLSVGKVAITSAPLFTNEAIMAFKVKDGYELLPDYIYYYLKGYKWDGINRAAMGLILNKASISQGKFSYPKIAEQERIVAELDLLTGIIDKQTAQLKELDMLAQSIFYDMFGDPVEDEKGWERKEIGQIAMVKTGPFGSMLHKDDYVSKGIPLVNPVHMRNYSISPDIDFTVTTEKAIELSEYLLHTGDVVFARRGDIGRCAVVFDKEDGFLCGTGSLFVRFNIPISSIFLMYVIRTESFRNELVSKAKGATMLNLNSGIISELKVPLPPEMMQQTFARKIEAIESQKAAINRSIAETRKLLDYTMDKYFG